MKKILSILLLVMYSFSVSGAVVQMHYCGDNLYSVSINEKKDCCCEARSSKNQHSSIFEKGCCDNKSISLKITETQQTASYFQLQLQQVQLPLMMAKYPIAFQEENIADRYVTPYSANAPPEGLWQDIPLFKLLKRYTYYG